MRTRSVADMKDAVGPQAESKEATIRELRAELAQARRALGDIGLVMTEVKKAIKSVPPLRLRSAAGAPAVAGRKPRVTLVMHITDWHIGLVVPEAMVEGFNAFNWALAQDRVAKLLASVLKYVDTQRHGYVIDEVVVLATGDYVSGDIHEGLVRTNEFQAPVQAVRAGQLLAWLVQGLAAAFPLVRVEFIAPGNHDRLTRKPQAQAGGENSWGYVVGCLARELLTRQDNVGFSLCTAMQTIVNVGGRRYLCGHGDGIIGTWGIPFYGIERKKMREATARMNMPEDRRFHRLVVGHFHTGLDHMDWLIGGSLSGTDENDHKEGRHAAAHQTTFMVSASHGEFAFTRWWL